MGGGSGRPQGPRRTSAWKQCWACGRKSHEGACDPAARERRLASRRRSNRKRYYKNAARMNYSRTIRRLRARILDKRAQVASLEAELRHLTKGDE